MSIAQAPNGFARSHIIAGCYSVVKVPKNVYLLVVLKPLTRFRISCYPPIDTDLHRLKKKTTEDTEIYREHRKRGIEVLRDWGVESLSRWGVGRGEKPQPQRTQKFTEIYRRHRKNFSLRHLHFSASLRCFLCASALPLAPSVPLAPLASLRSSAPLLPLRLCVNLGVLNR